MTAIRDERWPASARSWVMKIVAMPIRAARSLTRSMITACVVTSRPVVGSSAISRDGFAASAIAIMTRWHMPPDISNG